MPHWVQYSIKLLHQWCLTCVGYTMEKHTTSLRILSNEHASTDSVYCIKQLHWCKVLRSEWLLWVEQWITNTEVTQPLYRWHYWYTDKPVMLVLIIALYEWGLVLAECKMLPRCMSVHLLELLQCYVLARFKASLKLCIELLHFSTFVLVWLQLQFTLQSSVVHLKR